MTITKPDARVIVPPVIALFALFSGLYCYYYVGYIPESDDIALVGASLDARFSQWLSEGFSKYSMVYPEWHTPITNLARPVANLIFYTQYVVFGRRFDLYFSLFYIIQLCGTLIVGYIVRIAGVSVRISMLFVILFLINPTFVNYGLLLLSFQFDVIASVFLLVAFLALWESKYILALAMLTLAVFLKEALFAPVAAAMTILIWKRHPSLITVMLIPLFLWAAQRLIVFGSLTAGNYSVSPGMWGAVTGIAKGILIWPTGLIPGAGMFGLLHGSISALLFYSAMFILNALLWATLVYSGFIILRRLLNEKGQLLSQQFELLVALYVWTVGAVGFCAVLGLSYVRYGANVYAFLLPFLAVMLFGDFATTLLKKFSKVIVFLLFVGCIGNAINFLDVAFSENWSANLRQHALYEALRALPLVGETIYVVNAPADIGASPIFFATAWQVAPKVTFVNQFSGCLRSPEIADMGMSVSLDGVLKVQIPNCASFKFSNADLITLAQGVNGEVQRPGIGNYRFPHARIVGRWFQDQSVPVVDFGSLMLVTLQNPRVEILAYNWREGRYEVYQREK